MLDFLAIVEQLRLVEMLDTSMCQKPAARMNFRGIRSSKFRHVYGQPAKKVRMVSISELQKSNDLPFLHTILEFTCFLQLYLSEGLQD